jgi:hypothetical protein
MLPNAYRISVCSSWRRVVERAVFRRLVVSRPHGTANSSFGQLLFEVAERIMKVDSHVH